MRISRKDPTLDPRQTARVSVLSLLAFCGVAQQPTLAVPDTGPVGAGHVELADAANAKITRLGGDATAPTVVRDESRPWMYRAGRSFTESPLPDGYPRPTGPGVIELKHYPSVRRAEFGGEGNTGNRGFWPLFRHISSRDIAMTAPVEMDMTDEGTTMSFLYQTRELGPVGDAEMGVVVRDSEPVWVVSMGFSGRRSSAAVSGTVEKLEALIREQDGWVSTGKSRWMGYNSPGVPRDIQWWEVQVIVERASGEERAAANDAASDNG